MRSRFFFARSYAAALIGAFALVIAPLAIALAQAALQMHQLAERSAASADAAGEIGAQSRALREAIVEMERDVRQAEVLGAPAVFDTYVKHRQRLKQVALSLAQFAPDPQAYARQAALLASEEIIHIHLRDNNPNGALDELPALYAAADALTTQAQDTQWRDRLAVAALPGELSRRLLVLGALAVPLALGLAGLFAWRLGAPVRRLSIAMRRLGNGDLTTPVTVRGAREVASLGDGLEWLRARLASLENARERFLRSVSHDLKTPIAAIAEGNALLREELYGPLLPKQRAVAALIDDNVQRLLDRIENLLRAAAIAPSAAHSVVGPVDLAELARVVIDDHRLAIDHRHLQIDATLDSPAIVNGDSERLRMVIDNLLSNAIKFAPEHSAIRLHLSALDGQLRLMVRDHGPGVASGEEERIFIDGVRGSAAIALGVPGTGHGLAIAREFAEAHGGRLSVDVTDRHGPGACFVLILPAAPEQVWASE